MRHAIRLSIAILLLAAAPLPAQTPARPTPEQLRANF
jgi:hypothetical protein